MVSILPDAISDILEPRATNNVEAAGQLVVRAFLFAHRLQLLLIVFLWG